MDESNSNICCMTGKKCRKYSVNKDDKEKILYDRCSINLNRFNFLCEKKNINFTTNELTRMERITEELSKEDFNKFIASVYYAYHDGYNACKEFKKECGGHTKINDLMRIFLKNRRTKYIHREIEWK